MMPESEIAQPLVLANRLLSLTDSSMPLNTPLKYLRPDGSVREPSGSYMHEKDHC